MPLRRKIYYCRDRLVGRESLKETRMLGAKPYFMCFLKEDVDTRNHTT